MKLDRKEIDKMDEVEIQKQLLINSLESKESLKVIKMILNFFLWMAILIIVGFTMSLFQDIMKDINRL